MEVFRKIRYKFAVKVCTVLLAYAFVFANSALAQGSRSDNSTLAPYLTLAEGSFKFLFSQSEAGSESIRLNAILSAMRFKSGDADGWRILKARTAIIRHIFQEISEQTLLEHIRQASGMAKLKWSDLSQDVRISYFTQGERKYVYKLEFETIDSIPIVLIAKQKKNSDKTEIEFERLKQELSVLDIVDVADEDRFPRMRSIPRTWELEFDDSDDCIKRLILMLKIEIQRGNIKNYSLPSFDEILLVGSTVVEMSRLLRILKERFDIQPAVVHVVNPNPNVLKRFKAYLKYDKEFIEQEFPKLKMIRFYPTFGKYINRYFKPYSRGNKISLAIGGSVFQYDVMGSYEQQETVRSMWEVMEPGGVFHYFGSLKTFIKTDVMALVDKEEIFYADTTFDIYIKSLLQHREIFKNTPEIQTSVEGKRELSFSSQIESSI